MPFHIVVSDHLHPAGWQALEAAPDVTTAGPFPSRAEVLAALPIADALIIRSATVVDGELLAAAPRLKVVARAGAQLDNIAMDLATRLGVMVIHVPTANLTAVAEHTFAMLLALARGIPQAQGALMNGEWPRHATLGYQLRGKTLGVIGLGRLGREVARLGQAFGMYVLAYDPYVDLSLAQAQGVEVADFGELLARADVVSLHTAYTRQTAGIMNAAAFAQMRPGAVFVNCTHAGLVDEAALIAALEGGHLGGAAVDTFAQEPPPPDHPLLRLPNVVATPHLNQNTVESQTLTSQQVVADTLAALRGNEFQHVANLPFNENLPYSSARPYLRLASKLGKLQGQLAEGHITRLEVELLGEALTGLARPIAATLLSGMLRPVDGRPVNWVSAPALAHEQGLVTAQAKDLVSLADYPNLIACRIHWRGHAGEGQRTVAGVLFGNGEARLVLYDQYGVDAYPEGYVLILENEDRPGVIGKVGTRLGKAGINIAQWRYGRDESGGRAVSFINLDQKPGLGLLAELESEPEIRRARLVRL